jgi:hypothetical protein
VSNSSAAFAFWPGFESGSGRDQADTLVIGSSAEGAVDRRCPRLRLDLWFFDHCFLKLLTLIFIKWQTICWLLGM